MAFSVPATVGGPGADAPGPLDRAVPHHTAHRIGQQVERCHEAGLAVALVATSVDNAVEIAELWDSQALDLLRQQQKLQVYRLAESARLLHATSTGGLIVVVSAPQHGELPGIVAELADRLRQPLWIGDQQVWPLVTLGARVSLPGESVEGASRQARSALAAARAAGGGTLHWSEPGPADDAPHPLALASDLTLALHDEEQLAVHFQPLRDLHTGELIGAEALLRWQHPRLGALAAHGVVEAAERCGMAGHLGRKVLDLALSRLAEWQSLVTPGFRLHVNVSPTELHAPGYVDTVEDLLDHHGVPASMLLLEITEGAAIPGHTSALLALHRLAALGIGLGIDDFGTGYSSIAYLSELPVDTVKVDRSLISGVLTSTREYELAGAVARLLSVMSVRVIAEGIESAEQAGALRSLGYRFGQGYHLGRPAPGELLTHKLRRGTPVAPSDEWRHCTPRPA